MRGVSIGVDQVLTLTWPKWVACGGRSKETVVFMLGGASLFQSKANDRHPAQIHLTTPKIEGLFKQH